MTRHTTTLAGLLVSSLITLSVATLVSGCDSDAVADDSMAVTELRAQVEDLTVRAQELADRDAISEVAGCYGRGHDEIFNHLASDQSVARAILSKCHTDDVATEVIFFGNPMASLTSLDALIKFIEDFAINTGYTGARNIVGDIGIELTGPDTATMLSATQTPHFIRGTGNPDGELTVDVVSARYVDELVRGKDGVWRASKKQLFVDQVWRGSGIYPFAPPPQQ